MSLVTASCSLLFWFNTLLSDCLLHIAHRSLWVYARVFTPCVCAYLHWCLLHVRLSAVCACEFQCMHLHTCNSFEGVKVFGPAHQTALRICLAEAEVQFKASNVQMCKKGYGFYISYLNNADIPYLAFLVQSLYNLMHAEGAFTWEEKKR